MNGTDFLKEMGGILEVRWKWHKLWHNLWDSIMRHMNVPWISQQNRVSFYPRKGKHPTPCVCAPMPAPAVPSDSSSAAGQGAPSHAQCPVYISWNKSQCAMPVACNYAQSCVYTTTLTWPGGECANKLQQRGRPRAISTKCHSTDWWENIVWGLLYPKIGLRILECAKVRSCTYAISENKNHEKGHTSRKRVAVALWRLSTNVEYRTIVVISLSLSVGHLSINGMCNCAWNKLSN